MKQTPLAPHEDWRLDEYEDLNGWADEIRKCSTSNQVRLLVHGFQGLSLEMADLTLDVPDEESVAVDRASESGPATKGKGAAVPADDVEESSSEVALVYFDPPVSSAFVYDSVLNTPPHIPAESAGLHQVCRSLPK